MHLLERTNADQVVAILKNALLRINLNIQRARGQCYDGAATKADEKTGVATQMEKYAHCYGHASNLAVADAIISLQCISDALKTVRGIGKLLEKSSQRWTRWTVRGEALAAVINNHAQLMELWDWSLTVSKCKNPRC